MAPTLHTARLALRPFAADDADAYADIRLHEKVVGWLPPPPAGESRAETADRTIRHFQDCWARHGVGPWAVCERESGRLVGQCGLRHLDDFQGVEVLWTIAPACWNRGYASEAAAEALRFGFEQVGLAEIFAITLPTNIASRKVMEKIGLGYRRETAWKGFDIVYYDIDRATWQSRRQ
ncbi:MAG: GNAT family N-acetyltransferase [Reyranellaceae bacterium]